MFAAAMDVKEGSGRFFRVTVAVSIGLHVAAGARCIFDPNPEHDAVGSGIPRSHGLGKKSRAVGVGKRQRVDRRAVASRGHGGHGQG
jgi:hypothetical protein